VSRIDRRFAQLASAGRKALVPYLVAGHPEPGSTPDLMHALVAAGADLLELGVPFSDPMADGPVIQAASEKALASNIGLAEVFAVVANFRAQDQDTPVILMGYMNPIEVLGVQRFAREAAHAGVDGVLIVDVPPEEVDSVRQPLQQHGLQQIFLVAPTTESDRMAAICELAEGFVYYVALKGVTGADLPLADQIGAAVTQIRSHTSLPVAVGFGIKSAADARAVGSRSDAVVIGSALVSALDQATSREQAVEIASRFLTPIRAALDET
jgi:tryptophan synthase alpha chain